MMWGGRARRTHPVDDDEHDGDEPHRGEVVVVEQELLQEERARDRRVCEEASAVMGRVSLWAISERVGEEEVVDVDSLVEFTVSTPRMASSSSAGGAVLLAVVGGWWPPSLYLSVSDARQASKSSPLNSLITK